MGEAIELGEGLAPGKFGEELQTRACGRNQARLTRYPEPAGKAGTEDTDWAEVKIQYLDSQLGAHTPLSRVDLRSV